MPCRFAQPWMWALERHEFIGLLQVRFLEIQTLNKDWVKKWFYFWKVSWTGRCCFRTRRALGAGCSVVTYNGSACLSTTTPFFQFKICNFNRTELAIQKQKQTPMSNTLPSRPSSFAYSCQSTWVFWVQDWMGSNLEIPQFFPCSSGSHLPELMDGHPQTRYHSWACFECKGWDAHTQKSHKMIKQFRRKSK